MTNRPTGEAVWHSVSAIIRSLVLAIIALAPSSTVCQINGCKYLYVNDFTSDPYSIAKQLRDQGRERGFVVIRNLTEVSGEDVFKTCIMTGSWSAGGFGGRVEVRVLDAVSRSVIGEAATGGTNWWGVGRTVRNAVSKLYSQLAYSGFDETVFRQKMQTEYPSRPKLAITEEEVRKTEPSSHIEGIWSDPEDKYRLAIVRAHEGSAAQYVGVIIRSSSPLWQAGEIKAELRSTASPDVFTSTYYMANKKPVGTMFTIERNVLLKASVAALPGSSGSTDLVYLRVWPTIAAAKEEETPMTRRASGTGFLINKQGLLATNWHVVANATHVTVAFPGWREAVPADVVIRDTANDLAILRLSDPSKVRSTCSEFPYQLSPSSAVNLGEHVSTIGYPLTPLLGANPKFTEGVVSSKTGLQDDPRSLQISAQVQPGSSGSPLFNADGNIVGIVVATLDAGTLYQSANVLPQNVNYAIKSDYLLNLLAMLPGQSLSSKTVAFSAERAAHCVATINAW